MDNIKNRKLIKENEKLKEWRRKLSLILKFSSKINTSNNLIRILETIADEIKEVLQSDRCTVFLLDKEKNELYSWVAHGLKSKQIRFPADKGLAGSVASTGDILNVRDAYKDNRFNPRIDKKTGYRTKTILCMPMKNQLDEVIGVFQVLNKKDARFTKQDEEILGLLSQQAAAAIENAQLYEELKKSFHSFINALAETIDARDPMTAGHSRRVCDYSILIAIDIGFSEEQIEVLKYASLLHDLGKIGVKESVLVKPGSLTEEEYLHIQSHPAITRKILERTYLQPKFRNIPSAASSHHENIDGSGYPQNLKGNQIPEMAKIIAVADVFDAVTYKRHYRDPMSIEKAVKILKDYSGNKFDPHYLNVFLNLKLYDILKILSAGAENEIPQKASKIFNNITLEELSEKINNVIEDEIIKEFNKYYPSCSIQK